MTGSEDAKQVVITAADSLVDRFSDKVRCDASRGLMPGLMLSDWVYQELGRAPRKAHGQGVQSRQYGRALSGNHRQYG
jgi:hypothetical protein